MNEHPKKAGLSFSLRADGLCVVLRADQIRHDTITGLVREWQEPGAQDDVEAALERLAGVCFPGADAHPAEVDALVEGVEGAACMDYAEMELSFADAVRLWGQLTRIIHGHRSGLQSGSMSGAVPHQRNGEAA
ncbi:hypothetical protein ABZ419_11120 [Streptomyces cinnamoneus]|uniref:hypothetical protein n=1 Tax=Streptomyces cinnamoneus TaxID=53446 RepID=UPI0033D84246